MTPDTTGAQSIPAHIGADLNPEQLHAVTAGQSGHVLVLAGAGSGKTTVLTRRIAFILWKGVPPHRIVALTFSRKAAGEMASRVRACCESVSPGSDALPLVTTFHGFALRVLCDRVAGEYNYSRLGFTRRPSLFEDRALNLLSTLSTSAERAFLGTDLLGLESLLATLSVSPENIAHLDDRKATLLREIEARFAQEKRRRNAWDFGDLINGALELFRQHPDVAAHYAQHFEAVLVDEFQDTNPRQISLLHSLLGATNRVFAVGDDDQAIYGFRGADVRPILNFREQFTHATIVKLQTNYRSVPGILKSANRIFARKPREFRKKLKPGKAGLREVRSRSVFVKNFATQDQLARWVVDKVQSLRDAHAISGPDTAMLFRLNHTREWMERYVADHFGARETPRMLTVHASKGLEFKAVFLCDLEEGIFPYYRIHGQHRIYGWGQFLRYLLRKRKSPISRSRLEEERRLFYVGVTRAQRFLFALSVREKDLFGRKSALERSRFVTYL